MSNCADCGKGWPEVRIDTYYGPNGSERLCDPCVLAGMDTGPAAAPRAFTEAETEALMLGETTLANLTP